MRRVRVAWLAAGVVAGLTLAACDQTPKGTPLASSGLKFNVKTGDVHRLRMVREERLTQGSLGAKETLSRHLGVECTFRVLGVEQDGTAHLRITFDRGFYKQGGELAKSDELPSIFKSYAGVGNPLAHISGHSLVVMVTPDWTVLSIEGMYDRETKTGLIPTIAAEYSLDSRQTRTDPLGDYAQGLRESMGYGMGRQICSDLMDLFPNGFFDTGETGYSRDGLGVGIYRGPKCTWMIQNPNASIVVAKTRAKLVAGTGGKHNPWDSPVTYELSGTKKGTLHINKNKGWIIGGRIDEKYSGKKVVHLGGSQTLTYPASFRRITRYELPK